MTWARSARLMASSSLAPLPFGFGCAAFGCNFFNLNLLKNNFTNIPLVNLLSRPRQRRQGLPSCARGRSHVMVDCSSCARGRRYAMVDCKKSIRLTSFKSYRAPLYL
jgi:hypothetical protein